MDRWPDQVELHPRNYYVLRGRKVVAKIFSEFVMPFKDGGNCGLKFKEEAHFIIGNTINVQWVVDAPFLAKPYRGSTSIATDDGLIISMVGTFKRKELLVIGNSTYTAFPVTNRVTGAISKSVKRYSSPLQVYQKHIEALNDCNWKGLMELYPNEAELHIIQGHVHRGRFQIGQLFTPYAVSREKGGLCGLKWEEESRTVVGGAVHMRFVVRADFLKEPYKASHSFVTDDGLLIAVVSSFVPEEMKFK